MAAAATALTRSSRGWCLPAAHLLVTGSHAEQGGMHCRHVYCAMAGLRQDGGSRVQMEGVVQIAGLPTSAKSCQ